MYRRGILTLLALLGALLSAFAVAEEPQFLAAEKAFPVTAEVVNPETLRLTWHVADGYYLYRHKLKFAVTSGAVGLGEPAIPAGSRKQDEFLGEIETLRGEIVVVLPLRREAPAAERLVLEVTSQGCADSGFCYPPYRQPLEIDLPAATAAAPAAERPLRELDALTSPPPGMSGDYDPVFNEEEDFIPVEKAFRFEAALEAAQPGEPPRIRLSWQVAPGTYLYQEKIQVKAAADSGATLGAFSLPPAKIKHNAVTAEGEIGDLAVYDQDFAVVIPLQRIVGGDGSLKLDVVFQGCAEKGFCYPPRKERVEFDLPATGVTAEAEPSPPVVEPAPITQAPPAPPAAEAAPLTEQDRMLATLKGGNIWLVLAIFFVAGLLLAFTPCVFPMIPILSGIIAGQGRHISARQGFVLSSVYVLSMALTYTVAGVLAGVFGQNLQAAFQDPWVLSVFAAIFVALALSMFGFYELQLPASLQSRLAEMSNRQQGGSLIGVAIMGLLSALIVGPCVAPPLAGALIYIGQTGDAVLGGLALFALSLGMGAPLILIGTSAGRLLPRAGAWMDTVKAVFGVGLLAVAIVLLERILPPAIAMLLWGGLMICSAVYLGALRDLPVEASGWARLWKGVGFVLLVYGSLMLVGAAAGGKDTVQPLRGVAFAGTGGAAAATPHELSFTRIKGTAELDRRLAEAKAAGEPVMLDFYADWCVSCKEMERYTFSDPAVIAELAGVRVLQADVTADDADDRALLHDRFGMPGPPAIIFWGRDGVERADRRVVGFMPAAAFVAHVKSALK